MTISRIIAGRQQKIIKKEGRRVATFYFICAGTAQFGIIIWEVSGTRSMYVRVSIVRRDNYNTKKITLSPRCWTYDYRS